MKQFYYNLQSKGGSGKSLLSYLLALQQESNNKAYFIDFDSSVRTSTQQLKFLQGKKPPRFAVMNLLDNRDKIDRQLLFENLLELSQKNYEEFYLDFGAPESDQIPSLISTDYNIDEFIQIQDELNAQFIFNVVIAGGSAYLSCCEYLKRITELVQGKIDVHVYINQGTFINHLHLIDEVKNFASIETNHIKSVKSFGDFDITAAPHKEILKKIEEGKGLDSYKFVERIKILKEISKI